MRSVQFGNVAIVTGTVFIPKTYFKGLDQLISYLYLYIFATNKFSESEKKKQQRRIGSPKPH